jgi:hypothetical protein
MEGKMKTDEELNQTWQRTGYKDVANFEDYKTEYRAAEKWWIRICKNPPCGVISKPRILMPEPPRP